VTVNQVIGMYVFSYRGRCSTDVRDESGESNASDNDVDLPFNYNGDLDLTRLPKGTVLCRILFQCC